ncbi:hypothetical protein ACTA71_003962 [Dictyostelium dimigraforme]
MEPLNDEKNNYPFTDLENLEIECSIKYFPETQQKKDKLRNLFILANGLKKQALDKCNNSKDGKEVYLFYNAIIEVGKEPISDLFYFKNSISNLKMAISKLTGSWINYIK